MCRWDYVNFELQRRREEKKRLCELIAILSCSGTDFVCALIKTVQCTLHLNWHRNSVAIVGFCLEFFLLVLCNREKSVDNCIIFSFFFYLIWWCMCVTFFCSFEYTLLFSLFLSNSFGIYLAVLLNCNQLIWNDVTAFNKRNSSHVTITTTITSNCLNSSKRTVIFTH